MTHNDHKRRGTRGRGLARSLRLRSTFISLLAVAALLAVFLPAGPASAQGTTLYVDNTNTNAVDNGDCADSTTPCKTISYAVSQAVTGDTISVAAGTYNETVTVPASLDGLVLNGNSQSAVNGFLLNANSVTVEGFTITGASIQGATTGIDIGGATFGHTITNDTVKGTNASSSQGILVGAQANTFTISGNEVTGWNTGIYLNPSHNIQITNNNIHANSVGIGSDTITNITITGNNIADNTTEGFGASNVGSGVRANFNRIVDTGVGIHQYSGANIDGIDNWWGCNAGPGNTSCDTIQGSVSWSPFLVLTLTPTPTSITTAQSSTLTASLTTNNNGDDTSGSGHVPDGISVAFGTDFGTVTPTSATTKSGTAVTTLTSVTAGTATVTATVDNAVASTKVTVTTPAPLPLKPASISLAPKTATVQTGSSQALTATVTGSDNKPLAGADVTFSVRGANSASKTVATGSNGTAAFSYKGTNAGKDTVTAFIDANGNGKLDSGELSDTATITWTSPPVTQVPFAPAQPAQPNSSPSCTYYSATQHNLCGGFRAYWQQFGGLAVYGYPLTEEFQEDGVTVQYFERARFEWHPGAWPARYDVELGLLGDVVTQGRGSEAPFQPTTATSAADCTFYAATGHNLCAGFRAYWEQFGGLAVYGMPISEEFQEQNPDTGKVYTVQYFERARFEWHPGAWPERYDVELGRLGAQILTTQYGVTNY